MEAVKFRFVKTDVDVRLIIVRGFRMKVFNITNTKTGGGE